MVYFLLHIAIFLLVAFSSSAQSRFDKTPALSKADVIPARRYVAVKKKSSRYGKKNISSARRSASDDFIDNVRVQILLDEANFSPGIIDGSIGYFTRKAVGNYNIHHGKSATDFSFIRRQARRVYAKPFTRYIITGVESRFLRKSLPYKPKEQVSVDYLGYRNMLELLAERFHVSEILLRRLNSGVNFYGLRTGQSIVVPKVTPFYIEDLPKDKSFPYRQTLSGNRAEISVKEKILRIFSGNGMIASFPITPGRDKFIPYGSWQVKVMITTPTFRWDKQMLDEGKRGDDYFLLPPGPNSPVGIFWAGLSKSGIGMHGTSDPRIIGRSRSAGCIRLTNWDALELPKIISVGSPVKVY